MNKKIQISAVELKAQSEVIVLNSSFVARTVRAAENLKRIKRRVEECSTNYVLDDDGNRKQDEKGKYVTEVQIGKTSCHLQPEDAEALYNAVIPFIEDLCTALIGEE
jgi:hypothetical protein